MTFPVIASTNTTADTTSASITVAMPSGIVAGNLLMVFCAQDANGTVTQSGGSDWTKIEQVNNSTICGLAVFAKIAAGSDTLTLTSTNSQDAAVAALRITGHGVSVISDIIRGTAATGADAAPDPPNCNPGTTKDWLWIAAAASDDDDNNTPYGPTNYTEVIQLESASSTSSCLIQVASRELNATQENPGTFTLAAAEEWVAQTFAVPPSPVQDADLTFAAAAAVTEANFANTGSSESLAGASAATFDGATSTQSAETLSGAAAAAFDGFRAFDVNLSLATSAGLTESTTATLPVALALDAGAAIAEAAQASVQAGLPLATSSAMGDASAASTQSQIALASASGQVQNAFASVPVALTLGAAAALLEASTASVQGALVCSGSGAIAFAGELDAGAQEAALPLGSSCAFNTSAQAQCFDLVQLAISSLINQSATVSAQALLALSGVAAAAFGASVDTLEGKWPTILNILPINRASCRQPPV